MQLRGDTDEAEKGIAEASGSDSEEDDEPLRKKSKPSKASTKASTFMHLALPSR